MLIPSKETFEAIFTIYRNQCAHCKKRIIDSDNYLNGKILFIENNSKDKPRYNPRLNENDMIDPQNLVIFCDWHGHKFEFNEDKFENERLKKISGSELNGLEYFEISNKLYDDVLQKFLTYHDPDRFSHIRVDLGPLFEDAPWGHEPYFEMTTCTGEYVKPTKHLAGGKFRIIDTHRKIQDTDKVIFYPKGNDFSKGVLAEIEIHSSMRLEGNVPTLSKGQYMISIRSLDDESRLKNDLEFTVL